VPLSIIQRLNKMTSPTFFALFTNWLILYYLDSTLVCIEVIPKEDGVIPAKCLTGADNVEVNDFFNSLYLPADFLCSTGGVDFGKVFDFPAADAVSKNLFSILLQAAGNCSTTTTIEGNDDPKTSTFNPPVDLDLVCLWNCWVVVIPISSDEVFLVVVFVVQFMLEISSTLILRLFIELALSMLAKAVVLIKSISEEHLSKLDEVSNFGTCNVLFLLISHEPLSS
jgi:hypothetical protein